jgi:hypothetical protein
MNPQQPRRPGRERAATPAAAVRVRCNGALHPIEWTGRSLVFPHHRFADLQFQLALDTPCRCAQVLQALTTARTSTPAEVPARRTPTAPPALLWRRLRQYRAMNGRTPRVTAADLAHQLQTALRRVAIQRRYAPALATLRAQGLLARIDLEVIGTRRQAVLILPRQDWAHPWRVATYIEQGWLASPAAVSACLRTPGGKSWFAKGRCGLCGCAADPVQHVVGPEGVTHLRLGQQQLQDVFTPMEFRWE